MPGPCGSLLPNDLGLFDMLGNVYEWCQDGADAFRPSRKGTSYDRIVLYEYIYSHVPRVLRGGAFSDPPANVRSAFRVPSAPSSRPRNVGFRLAKTRN